MSDFSHKLEFSSAALSGISEPFFCTNVSFHGTMSGTTTEEIKVTPTYSGCETTPIGSGDVVHFNFNECQITLTPRSAGDATAGYACPAGQSVVANDTATGCVKKYLPQKISNAVTYDTIIENNKHAITLNVTASGISFTLHGGLCVFVPTSHNDGLLAGSLTVRGQDPAGEPVNITAT